jgi:hypothetical protein
MDPSAQASTGYYVWQIPGKAVSVHLHLDVIDRLSAEVMRGFGAIPKRGAEVGGVLLGTIEPGEPCIVRVEDFEPVACEYKRGPSYLFTADDGEAFDETCARWRPDPSRPMCGVGYFRSQTRDGLSLVLEDIDIMEQYFPAPASVVLLVKPFATKVSIASFFFREDGLFQTAAPLEFPFRRRELTGEEAPPRRTMLERSPRVRGVRGEPLSSKATEIAEPYSPPANPGYTPASRSRSRPGWVWLPMSFVFLLLGMALGFLVAVSVSPRAATISAQELSLGLSVVKAGDSLNVRWNRESPAIRTAPGGSLEIEEAGKVTPVILDKVTLQSGGNIVYTNSSGTVHFRLKVSPKEGLVITETAEWKKEPGAGSQ